MTHAHAHVDRLGRYLVDECIGTGGMGEVFRGFDPELDRAVAIKRLVAFGTDDEARIRLQREAQAIARLSHPHVVQVFDVGRDGPTGDLFIAMELVDGVTLRQWLRQTPRSWRAIAEVFRQAGEGLHAAHQQGIVHRDFKPENVLITYDGVAKVVDFGLAKPAGEHTEDDDEPRTRSRAKLPKESAVDPFQPTPRRTTARSRPSQSNAAFSSDITPAGARLGTPAYMPPEQGAGMPSTARADQFSFCVALFEALAGYLPFPGENPAEYSVSVLEGQLLEFPRGTAVPRRLQDAIYRGLETDPRARFVSLRPLLDELGRDPIARRRRALALGGAVVIGGAAALGVSAVTPPKADELRNRCESEAAVIDTVWTASTRAEILDAIAGVDAPFAADTAERVGPALDRLGEGWRAARVRWCTARPEAAASTATVSAAIGLCLDRVLMRERELVASLRQADTETIARAVDAIERLDRELVRCDEPAFLSQLVSDGTPDADEQGALEHIAHARQRLELGQAREGLRALEQVDPEVARRAPIALERGLLHGTLEQRRGNLALARALLEDAARAGLGAEAPLLAAEWHANYGDLLYELGELDEMAGPYERAFELRRRHLGPDDPETLVVQAARGHVPYARGDYSAALAMYREAADHAAATASELDHERILVDEWVAQALSHTGDLAEARDLTLDLVERLRRSRGDRHPRTLDLLHTLGTIELRAGRDEDALAHLTESLAGRGTGLQERDPISRATALANIGAAQTALARHAEAEASLRDALDQLSQAGYGVDHENVIAVSANLGSILDRQGKHAEALAMFEDLASRLSRQGLAATANGIMVRFNLAASLTTAKRPREALDVLDGALADAHKSGDDVLVGRVELERADVYEVLGDDARAAKALAAAAEAFEGQPADAPWVRDLAKRRANANR